MCMDRQHELELIRRVLVPPKDRPRGSDHELPVARYTAPERFTRELDAIMRRRPNVAAMSQQLPSAGSFVTQDLHGTPVLLIRGDDGVARAFVNVCRHRGATVELSAEGSRSRFECPYHGWSYRRDGKLTGVPHSYGFPNLDKGCSGLRALDTHEAAGFIWVTPQLGVGSAQGAPDTLLDELRQLGTDRLTVFRSSTRTVACNWKLIVDGGLESYHFRVAHKRSIGPYFIDNASLCETFGDHIRQVLPRTSMQEMAKQPESTWQLRQHANLLYSLFPNASLLVQKDHAVLVRTFPVAVDQTRIEISTLAPAAEDASNEHWNKNHEITDFTLNEDWDLAEQIQRGISSGANETFRFASFEDIIVQRHARFDALIAEETA